MKQIPFSTGFSWILESIQLFSKQPSAMMLLASTYLCLTLLTFFIPHIGQFIASILIPLSSIAFIHAARRIQQKQNVLSKTLFKHFNKDNFPVLFKFSALYLALLILLTYLSDFFFKSPLQHFLQDNASSDFKNLFFQFGIILLYFIFIIIPLHMTFLLTPPLLVQKNLSLSKGLFYSFISVTRSIGAFIAYFFSFGALILILSTLLEIILSIFTNDPTHPLLFIVRFFYFVLCMAIYCCSYYPIYTCLFDSNVTNTSEHHSTL
jgi:hypothetical protein